MKGNPSRTEGGDPCTRPGSRLHGPRDGQATGREEILARQVQEMQVLPPEIQSPSRTTMPSATGFTPPPLTPEATRRRGPLEPFARKTEAQGPYQKPNGQDKKDSAIVLDGLEDLDGYGPV